MVFIAYMYVSVCCGYSPVHQMRLIYLAAFSSCCGAGT